MATIMHLSDGTMIMGEVEESSSSKKAITVKNPIEIIMSMSSEESYVFYGRVWMPFTDQKEITLNADHVIAFGVPSEKVMKYYIKLTTDPVEENKKEFNEESLEEDLELLAKQNGRYH